MDNEYEIDGFDFEEKEQENIPQEEPQEIPQQTLQEEPQEIPQEEPQEEQQELSMEEPAPQKKESPFADSPYVMAAQPIRQSKALPKSRPRVSSWRKVVAGTTGSPMRTWKFSTASS